MISPLHSSKELVFASHLIMLAIVELNRDRQMRVVLSRDRSFISLILKRSSHRDPSFIRNEGQSNIAIGNPINAKISLTQLNNALIDVWKLYCKKQAEINAQWKNTRSNPTARSTITFDFL